MDPHSVAIEQDIAFSIAAGSQTAEAVTQRSFVAPVADESFDSAAPDIELCRLAAGGNLAAFELIYERYHRRTYSLCMRMTSSQTEAEDLTQEVFIQLFYLILRLLLLRRRRWRMRFDQRKFLWK